MLDRVATFPLQVFDLARRCRQRYFPTRLDKLQTIHGWTVESQLRYLMSVVRALPDQRSIVEVGVWQGRSALAMGEACRGTRKRVYAIDPWEEYIQGGVAISSRLEEWGVSSFEDIYQAFLGNRRVFNLEQWVIPLRARSLEAAAAWTSDPPAFVFIDGHHDYDRVTADLTAWYDVIPSGGIISGDDWIWESVRRAVEEFVARHPTLSLSLPCENTWQLKKE
jgi:hypothetical protein